MDAAAASAIIDALADASIDEQAKSFILAEIGERPEVAPEALADGPIFIESVEVEGFRGIGPPARLELAATRG